jgi:50S ribosomal subunit-associated GTPase HflX
VSKKEGEIEAAKYNSKHFEVSAKQGKRMDELFNNIIDLITEHIEEKAKLPVIEDN